MKKTFLIVFTLVIVAILAGACAAEQPAAPAGVTPDEVNAAIDAKFTTYNGTLPLWKIQPGTAPRMIELTTYFNNMWFGAQAGNWDLARFEAYRSEETTKAVYVTRTKRISVLKPWADSALPALITAIEAKNLADFEAAYDTAIAGCNGCHAGSSGGPLKSMGAFKITRPTTPIFSNIDFKGP